MIDFSLIRLSQGQLNLLATCPPLFEKSYLEQLQFPNSQEQEEKQNWGSRFHLLMQQRELGLPIDSFLAEDPQMARSLHALIKAAPNILESDEFTWRDAEHCRTLNFQGYLLTVIYDLLVVNDQVAQIIDWKTYLQPENKLKLANNWQTRLYLYVLAETSTYLPEQISLTYWFVKLPTQPQSLTFKYSMAQHEQTIADLTKLLTQLTQWLEAYESQGINFPHRSDCEQKCPYFSSLISANLKQKQPNWDNLVSKIDEIPI